jgi:hypothetical protein
VTLKVHHPDRGPAGSGKALAASRHIE